MPSRRARQGSLGAPLLFDYRLIGTGEDLNSEAFSGTHIQSLHGSAQTGIYAEGDWAGFRCPSLLKRIELQKAVSGMAGDLTLEVLMVPQVWVVLGCRRRVFCAVVEDHVSRSWG